MTEPISKVRLLVTALSVLSAIACVLLIVLRVRSNHWEDSAQGYLTPSRYIYIGSSLGEFIGATGPSSTGMPMSGGWNLRMNRIEGYVTQPWGPTSAGFGFAHERRVIVVVVPHWLLSIGFATLAISPWIRYRFSLRTLLIVTTLVAITLGFVAVALH